MNVSLAACVAALALSLATPAFAEPPSGQMTTITGKVVDLGTYMTHDHNMDSMKGDAMKGDAMKDDSMKGDSMKGDAMHGTKACPSLLGVVSQGKAYPLTFQMGSTMAATACAHVGASATMTGSLYESNGLTILLVQSMH